MVRVVGPLALACVERAQIAWFSRNRLHRLFSQRPMHCLRANGTIVVWGDNYYGQTNMAKNLTNVIAVAAGPQHSVALREEGTVVAWGRNLYGMTNVPAGLSNVVAIAAGFRHSLALVSDGTVVAWGKNDGGQSSVPPGLSNVRSIAAGGDTFSGFSLAALSDGSTRMTIHPSDLTLDAGSGFRLQARAVSASSLSYQWRVGGRDIPDATNCFFAVDPSNISDSDAYDVVVGNSLGSVTSLVAQVRIKPSDVVAWDGNTQRQTVVPADLTNAIAISAGVYHTLAVKPDGTVAAWGSNGSGGRSFDVAAIQLPLVKHREGKCLSHFKAPFPARLAAAVDPTVALRQD